MKITRRAHGNTDQLAHITREMYKQNLELAERNKTLTLLRRIDEITLGPEAELAKMTQQVSELLISQAEFALSLLYVAEKENRHLTAQGVALAPRVIPEARSRLSAHLGSVSAHPHHKNAVSFAVASSSVQIISSFTALDSSISDSDSDQLKEDLGVHSIFVCPLQAASRLIGLLVLGTPMRKVEISVYQKNLVDRLTGAISVALDNKMLFEENQRVAAQLRKTNAKLRALDEAKDEFISMASHQLRTPLTTIKGYLSMILDGDVGAVKKNQKEMVQHAFDSAQRMVYLIADLLNVSRLQTGKFVIENQPTDLTKLVEGEIGQLQETAESRQLKLIYHKPDKFPMLNLDETKIRQVVMNFLDNAIYYTPAEGSVTAELTASDEAVSFTVTDTGLGVPASVQHHLFSKFYRADNARKMRPDGTGLGLFMAKKVVVAQGGAIIFKSTEGKGSTFGFSFPRKDMEIKDKKLPDKSTQQKEVALSKT